MLFTALSWIQESSFFILMIKNYKTSIASIILSCVFFLLSSVQAEAAVVCQPIYGGGQTCVQVGPVVVNKMVVQPRTGMLVEGLGQNDDKFFPDNPITFQISITNTGQTVISRVVVEDILPQEVTNIAGPGTLSGKTLTFEIQNLNPGQTREERISGTIVSASQLPADKAINCDVANQVKLTVDGQPGSADRTPFCIQRAAVGAPVIPTIPPTTKGGLKVFPPPPVTVTPPTGAEALLLLALIPSGVLGAYLRRKANRE